MVTWQSQGSHPSLVHLTAWTQAMDTNEITHVTVHCELGFRTTMGAVATCSLNGGISWGTRGCQGKEVAALDDLGVEVEGLP